MMGKTKRTDGDWRTTFTKIWEYERPAEWDPDYLLALFLKHFRGTATKEDSNQYAQQLMVLTAQCMAADNWVSTFSHELGAGDVGNIIVMHILAKTDRFRFKVPIESLPSPDGYKVLLRAFRTTIARRLLDMVQAMKEHPSSDGMDQSMAPSPKPDVDRLAQILTDESTIDRLIIGADADVDALVDLIKIQVSEICTRNTLLSYNQLSDQIRSKITPEVASLITFRVNRCVRSHAQELT